MSKFVDVSGLRRVENGLKGIASGALSAANSLGRMVPALGAITGATTLAGIGKLVTDFSNMALELTKTGMVLDETPEKLSGVAQAMRSIGGNAQTAIDALSELKQATYEAAIGLNGMASYTFYRLNVAIKDHAGNLRDVIDVEEDFFKALDKQPYELDRQTYALKAGGKALYETYLQYRAAGLSTDDFMKKQRQMQTLDAQRTKALRDMSLAMGGLNAAFYDLGGTIAGVVAPVVTPLFQELSKYITQHKGEIEADIRGMAKAFQDWVESGGAAKAVDNLGKIGSALAKIIEAGEWFVAHPALAGALLGAYAGGRVGGAYGAIGGAVVGAVAGRQLGQPAADSAYDEYLRLSNPAGNVLSREQFVQQYNQNQAPPPVPFAGQSSAPASYYPQKPAPAAAPTAPAPPAPAATPTPAPGPQGAADGGMIIPAGWSPDANAPAMQESRQTISHPERNNPGNLRVGPNAWLGKTTAPGAAFESFDTPEHGVRARALTYNSYLKRGVNTIAQIAATSGPASDNNDIPSQIAAYRAALGGKYAEPGGENLAIEATPENIRRLTAGGLSIEAGGGGKWLPKGYGYATIDKAMGMIAAENAGGANPAMAAGGGGGKVLPGGRGSGGVNAALDETMRAAWAAVLPKGWTARMTAGKEGGHAPNSQHHGGNAEDWQIYDQDGKPVSNRGVDTSGYYQKAAVAGLAYMTQKYPDLAQRFAWGGHFETSKGSRIPDLMHYDIGKPRASAGAQFGDPMAERKLLAQAGGAEKFLAGLQGPNGGVDINITHKNAPANVQLATSSYGTGLNLAAPRVEHQRFGQI